MTKKSFERTYNRLVAERSFRDIFLEVFVPFLYNIGLEWQSNHIIPAHEHFISNLIKQKLHINIERIQQNPSSSSEKVFVLFLPINEIHELGLLYLHYELILKGYHSIYLGQSVPMENLKVVQEIYPKVSFISYFTVQPTIDSVMNYLKQFQTEILTASDSTLWILGRNVKELKLPVSLKNIKVFNNLEKIINKI